MSATDLTNPMHEPPQRGGTTLSRTLAASSTALGPAINVPAVHRERLIAPTWMPDGPTLLRSLRNCWKLAIGLGAVVGVLAAAAIFVVMPAIKPLYKAQALLRIVASEPRLVFPTSMDDRADFNTFRSTQSELLRTRNVLNGALNQPRVAQIESVRQDREKVLHWIEKELKVENLEGTEITRISMMGTDASELALYTDAVVDAYLVQVVARDHEQREQRYKLLKSIYDNVQKRLADSWRGLPTDPTPVEGKPTQTITDEQRRSIEQYSEMLRRRTQVESQRQQMQWKLDRENAKIARANNQQVSPSQIELVIDNDPEIQEMQQNLQTLEKNLRKAEGLYAQPEMLRKYRDPVVNLRAEIERKRTALKPVVEQKLKERIVTEASEGGGRLVEDYEQLEAERAWLEKMIQGLAKEVQAIRTQPQAGQPDKQPAAKDVEVARLELERLDTVTRYIKDEVEACRVELDAPMRITKLQDAEIFVFREARPEVKLISSGLAGLGGFLLVLVGASYREFRSGRLYTAQDVTSRLGIRVIGSLPVVPEQGRRLPRPEDAENRDFEYHVWTESLDAIRAQIVHEAKQASARVFLVSSAVGSEGKSTLAANLALRMAYAGKKTLLIDGDLIRPRQHDWFGAALEPGLGELLRGQKSLADVIRPTPAAGLWLITAGQVDQAAMQTLAQDAMNPILDRLKKEFDLILIDGSPLLPVVHALSIGKHVDRVLLSLLSAKSTTVPVYAAMQRLLSLDIRVMGAVLSGTKVVGYPDYYSFSRQRTQRSSAQA